MSEMACPDFWGCVARSVESIAVSLPQVPHGNGYVRIELATQLKRLVDIMECASHAPICSHSSELPTNPENNDDNQINNPA